MAEQWGALESTRTIFFEWTDQPPEGERHLNSNSLSGQERNRIFFRRDGNYEDLSLVSGADFMSDGRSFVLFDYDRDGWLDLGVASSNHPRFRIVRNKIGDQAKIENQFLEISLVGGQTSASPSDEWSSRDAFGSMVKVTTSKDQRLFQLSCGEGLSGVNAQRIHVGLGPLQSVDRIEVLWPSGKTTVLENVEAGERITVYENPEMSKD
ncbi:CRTAC1 family protein [bacterium]|nr:CRTAC1 family protein [bacterium]